MIADHLKPEKLITTKRNLEYFSILHDHQLWHEVISLKVPERATIYGIYPTLRQAKSIDSEAIEKGDFS